MTRRLLAAVLAAPALAGCSVALEPSLEPPPAPASAVRGGELRIGIPTPSSVDPAQAYDRSGQLVVSAMCDPLLEVDPATGVAAGGLSEHVVPEADGNGVTVTVKEDLRFSDGSELAAKDIRASLSRVASDDLASPMAEELRTVAGFGEVHGDVPVEDEDDPSRTVLRGVSQVTNRVVTVTVTRPDAEFQHRLSRPWAAVVPAAAREQRDFAAQPVCVGPYRMAKPWEPGDDRIELVRNEHYEGTNERYTGGGLGYPDRVVFRVYRDDAAAYRGFLAGEVDVVRPPRSVLASSPAAATLSTVPTSSVEYLGLPTGVKPFDDPRVRQALSLAVDREALVRALRPRDRVPAHSLLPGALPFALGSTPACTAASPVAGDVAAARRLLAEAGVDLRGTKVPLYVNDEKGSDNRRLVEAVAAQWRAAFGIAPRVVALPWDRYRERGRSADGFDGPFRTSWSASTPSLGAFVQPLLLSSAIGSTNWSRFSDPQVEREYPRRVAKETDLQVRALQQRRLLERVCAAAPLVPLWYGTESYLVRDRVASATGRLQHPVTGALDVRELFVRGD